MCIRIPTSKAILKHDWMVIRVSIYYGDLEFFIISTFAGHWLRINGIILLQRKSAPTIPNDPHHRQAVGLGAFKTQLVIVNKPKTC